MAKSSITLTAQSTPAVLAPVRKSRDYWVWFATLTAQGTFGGSTLTFYISFDQGTTWGQKIEDKVRQVSFVKDETFTDLEIFYASRESLQRYGIDLSQTKQYFAWPSAFEDKKSFCKVPDWYRA